MDIWEGKCQTCGGSMQNPDLSSLNRNCPDCHDGKLRLEVECEKHVKLNSCIDCGPGNDGCEPYRPMTVQEVEELSSEGNYGMDDIPKTKWVSALIADIKEFPNDVTYKGQRVRVK